jgi:predicted DNA-binding helix-hairpin-helix protein
MSYIHNRIQENSAELVRYRCEPSSRPRAEHPDDYRRTPETDFQILNLSESFYHKYKLSAFSTPRIFLSEKTHAAVARNQASAAARAPAVPSRLAAALLRFFGQ